MESLKQINLNVAGVHVGATELYVCVPEDRDAEPVRVFETFTYRRTRSFHAAWSPLMQRSIKSLSTRICLVSTYGQRRSFQLPSGQC